MISRVGEVWGAYYRGDVNDPEPFIYLVVHDGDQEYTLLILERAGSVPGTTCEVHEDFFNSYTTERIA